MAAADDQLGAVHIDSRRRIVLGVGGRSVQPDQGVEVDDATALELGDLGELHPHQLPRRSFGQAEMVSDFASESDGEPPP